MWIIVTLIVLLVVLAAVGSVIGPFLTFRRLPDRVESDGIAVVRDGFVSVGVVPMGEREVALVDAGNDKQGKAILGELARRGLGPDDVKVILLTHGHPDHMGAIRLFPNAQVMALADEVDVVEGRATSGAALFRFVKPKPTGIRVARALQDGESLALGAYAVRVFAIPGHTPGSAAYAIGENLFLGDSANQDKKGHIRLGPAAFSMSAALNRKSLVALSRRLADNSSIKTLVFSHSAAMSTGLAPLREFARRG
jgi:glyoxylase-like metal-dependent hydrolase (beta-lactamase superfamily II)